jgi:pimeloyl-ACP methyl ester carboxylesterase
VKIVCQAPIECSSDSIYPKEIAIIVAKSLMLSSALLLSSSALAQVAAAQETQIEFAAQSGESVDALQGSLDVRENRRDPESRMITLSYVRFPATSDNPGPPIVYLAGGPGGSGSGTARGRRFPLFMAMRQHGDIIAFDQRGTGGSTELPECTSSIQLNEAEALSDGDYDAAYRAAVVECRVTWRTQGIDITGYTTQESVHDLSALRQHLGAETMTLWGISYGSHLALAALNEIPEEIERVVIASAEGLDQTVKLPARTDAYIGRLQNAVNSQPAARAAYPDIAGLIRRVNARLDAEPMLVQIPQTDADPIPFLIQRRHAQQMGSSLISDPFFAALALALYSSLDQGDGALAAGVLARFQAMGFLTLGQPITLQAMPTAMDMASGISAGRLAEFERQRETALFGSQLNFPMPQIGGAWDDFDLGDDFRSGPTGGTPVLLLTGTLDGRTYPQGQAEAVAGLTNVTQVTIVNAGHNLFMSSPDVHGAIHQFMRGETVRTPVLSVDLPDLTANPFGG